MKRVRAQFRPARRPSRWVLVLLAVAAVCTVAAAGVAEWQHLQLVELRRHIALLEEERRNGRRPPPRPDPPYAASARAMLHERTAPWAPMLRTIESASMIGVTPTAVDFNAVDGTAHAALVYADTGVLVDYMQRINEGVPVGNIAGRWSVVQVRVQPAAPGAQGALTIAGGGAAPAAQADIRSVWIWP